jgi:NAD(P)-dependent dehydrogenase (short-subunit alcohol dehydrogenase family)
MTTTCITGANRGIGLELARRCRARGDDVIALVRSSSAELDATGARVVAGVDVSDERALAAAARDLAGTAIDVLVCNAGMMVPDQLDAVQVDDVVRQFQVNALGPLLTVRALRGLLRRGAKVALITSRMGSIDDNTSGRMYGYRMSKAALNMAGKSLALDLAGDGVSVVVLHPGAVRTDMTGGGGQIDVDESARGLLARIDALTPATSGAFLHQNGTPLPW